MALISWEHPTATHRILCPPTPIPPTLVRRIRPSQTPQARQIGQNHPPLSAPGACVRPMTTSPSPATASASSSNGESLASLPRWRQFLSMLNWRRDPDYEQRMNAKLTEIEQIKARTKQIEKETEQL